jgi:putative tryptophan/tyrosine transport system substrate-binding protein
VLFRSAKPAELPVEQPSRFELAINLKTAKALGANVPYSQTILAAELIE